MGLVAPSGPVYQAGTLSGNPISVAAGVATLRALSAPGTYERLESLGAALADGLEAAVKLAGVAARIQRVGSMLTLFFAGHDVGDLDEAKRCDTGRHRRFFHGMLDRGVYLPPSQLESAFVSLAHTPDDVAQVVGATGESLESLERSSR